MQYDYNNAGKGESMLSDIIRTQKNELETKMLQNYVERDMPPELPGDDLVKVIIGPRRSGKSCFGMNHISKSKNWAYVNFDDERLMGTDFDSIMDAINIVYGDPCAILFDEIQNMPSWELFINRMHRSGKKIYITGSNAHMLSTELATHLTGRYRQIIIFPFSYREFLRSLQQDEGSGRYGNRKSYENYLTCGGYPEIVMKNLNPSDYISTLVNAILYKDIVKRYKIRKAQMLENLFLYLMSNIAKKYTLNSLSKAVGINSVHTVEKFLSYLEQSFLCFSIRQFSYRIKSQLRLPRKVYAVDNSFATCIGVRFSPDFGRLCENLVAIVLKKMEIAGGLSFYYWNNNDGEEVDFVIKRGLKIDLLIQVCFSLDKSSTYEREIRALLKCGRDLKCDKMIILSDDVEKTETARWFGITGEIRHVPISKWLENNGQI
jgi:predicted AAA+ superfamily ATPase